MSLGVKVFSDHYRTGSTLDSQVLIDSGLQSLHYAGQATFIASLVGPTDFPGYSGTNDSIDGHVLYSYSYVTEGVPTVFIRPSDYTKWHAVIRQGYISQTTTWEFEVIQSGSDSTLTPELHLFLPNTYITPSTESYGMQLFGDIPLRGPTVEKVMTIAQSRTVEATLTTESSVNTANAALSTCPTPLQIAGSTATLTGSASAPANPALGDIWIDIGSHSNGYYPKPIAPTYPTLVVSTMEERTWSGLDTYMASQNVVMHNGHGTQVFGQDVMKYLNYLNDYNWCVANSLYSFWQSSSRQTLLNVVSPVVATYWGPLGAPQSSDGYSLSISYITSVYNAAPDGIYNYAYGWSTYYTYNYSSGWKSYLQPRYSAYQTAYAQHIASITNQNLTLIATYDEEVYMYNKLLDGYNSHYSGANTNLNTYVYGTPDYGVYSDNTPIVSSPTAWLVISEVVGAPAKQLLTGGNNVIYSVAKPNPVTTAWENARDAYYATMVAAQAVTTDQTLTITPATLEELYRSVEYTYDWNVFSTIATGSATLPTFDSRLKPLVVVSGGSITSPATPVSTGSPTDSGTFTGIYYDQGVKRWYWSGNSFGGSQAPGSTQNDWDFRSAGFSTSSNITAGLTQGNLMFAAPSLTQAVQMRSIRGYSEYELWGWYITWNGWIPTYHSILEGIQRQQSVATWWVMYLNAFKITGSSFKSGWATYDGGFEYSADWDAGAVGFWPWDDDDDAGSVSYGSIPYDPKTINRKSNMYIITDVTKYT